MHTNYPVVIKEELATLMTLERTLRGRRTAVRVQALRLLKSGVARSLDACATLVGHSPRQVARWWAIYRRSGVAGLTQERSRPGKSSQLTPAALAGLETAMVAGQITTLADAQRYLAEAHGIVYGSLNGVWWQLRKHQIKLKTGRRRHESADAAAQEAFRAGFRGDAGDGGSGAGLGLR